MAKNKAKRRRESGGNKQNDNNMDSWVSSLVKKFSEPVTTTTKQERIEKRAEKKRRKERLDNVSGRQPLTKEPTISRKIEVATGRQRKQGATNPLVEFVATQMAESARMNRRTNESSSSRIQASRKWKKRKQWASDNIQPRKNDYGGCGLARESLFLEFSDPSLLPKLEVEFKEHIPGFFGKQRSRMKKKESKMLWRRLAEGKEQAGKKLGKMNADERVEAALQAGLL